MATAIHYEALRKKRMLEKMKEAQERAAQKACEADGTDGKVSEEVNRDEMARVIYKDLHKQERRLRDNCLVMGALENYVDDEYTSKKIREAEKHVSNNQ